MTSITSDEVNYLIWRYLQEAGMFHCYSIVTNSTGFVHSSFVFAQESFVAIDGSRTAAILPGALITLLQKGLFYCSVEHHLNDDGTERQCTRPFSLFQPHECASIVADHIQSQAAGPTATTIKELPSRQTTPKPLPIVTRPPLPVIDPSEVMEALAAEQEEGSHSHETFTENGGATAPSSEQQPKAGRKGNKKKNSKLQPTMMDIDSTSMDQQVEEKPSELDIVSNDVSTKSKTTKSSTKRAQANSSSSAKDANSATTANRPTKSAKVKDEVIPAFHNVAILNGHTDKVLACAWNPARNIRVLASASGDGTVRLWTVPSEGSWSVEDAQDSVRILSHNDQMMQVSNDQQHIISGVTALAWNDQQQGTLLATGASDGCIRIWNVDGDLLAMSPRSTSHQGAVFKLSWSPDNSHLVSLGEGPAAILWSSSSTDGPLVHVRSYEAHSLAAMDVTWHPTLPIFCTCAADAQIHIYSIHHSTPLAVLSGHGSDVNAVQWSPDGTLLLSCSDDHVAYLWTLPASITTLLSDDAADLAIAADQQNSAPLVMRPTAVMKHDLGIYSAQWASIDAADDGNQKRLVVALTGDFGGMIKMWNVSNLPVVGEELLTLSAICTVNAHHTRAVYAMSVSPNHQLLCSGGLDGRVRLWTLSADAIILQKEFSINSIDHSVDEHRESLSKNTGIFDVAWSRSGHRLAASSEQGPVIVLDVDQSI